MTFSSQPSSSKNKFVQRDFVVSAPRQALQTQYRLDGKLPFDIGEKLFARQSSAAASLFEQEREVEQKILQNFLKDDRIRPGTKEQVARAVLRGDYEVETSPKERTQRPFSPVHPQAAVKDAERRAHQLLLLNRHSLPRPHFMEVVTESTTIPAVSPRAVRRENLSRLRRQFAGKSMTPSSSTILESLSGIDPPDLSPKQKRVVAPSTLSKIKSEQSKLIMQDKARQVEQFKRKMAKEKQDIQAQKTAARLSIEKKVEIKKKLNEVRKQINDYLKSKHDPKRGDIMRCIDESMIYHFISKYDGLSMSAEAILTLIGNAIGSAILTPDLHTDYTDLPTDHDGRPSTGQLLASQSMELGHNSIINNYRAFGIRQPPQPPAWVNSEILPTMASSQDWDAHWQTMATETGDYQLDRISQTDPVRGMSPRRYQSGTGGRSSRPSSSSPERTLAAGFRVHPPAAAAAASSSSSAVLHSHRPGSRPSTAAGEGGEAVGHGEMPLDVSHMVVMSSQHLRRVASEMGLDISRSVAADSVLPHQASWRGEDGHPSSPSSAPPSLPLESTQTEDVDASNLPPDDEQARQDALTTEAIAVMHEQLLEEELLPSMRPERVLTPTQLDALGQKRRSWDDIFREVSRQGARSRAMRDSGESGVAFLPGEEGEGDMGDDTSSLGDASVVPDQSPKRKKKGQRGGGSGAGQTTATPHGHRLHLPRVASKPTGDNASHASSRSSLIEDLLEGEQKGLRARPPHLPATPPAHSDGVLCIPASTGVTTSAMKDASPAHRATQPVAFFGSLAQSHADKQRLQTMAENERRQAENRLVLPSLRPPENKLSAGGGGDVSPLKLLTMSPEEFAAHNEPLLAKGPRALKSRGENQQKMEAAAKSPFESWAAEMAVLTHGIPSGAGLRLYRPHEETTPQGRYHSSHGKHTAQTKKPAMRGKNKPFVAAS